MCEERRTNHLAFGQFRLTALRHLFHRPIAVLTLGPMRFNPMTGKGKPNTLGDHDPGHFFERPHTTAILIQGNPIGVLTDRPPAITIPIAFLSVTPPGLPTQAGTLQLGNPGLNPGQPVDQLEVLKGTLAIQLILHGIPQFNQVFQFLFRASF